jgi:hypothetical protein
MTAIDTLRTLRAELETLNWADGKSAQQMSDEIARLALSDDPARVERMDCLFQCLHVKYAAMRARVVP